MKVEKPVDVWDTFLVEMNTEEMSKVMIACALAAKTVSDPTLAADYAKLTKELTIDVVEAKAEEYKRHFR